MKVRVMSMRYQGSQRVSKRADHVMSIFKTRINSLQKSDLLLFVSREREESGKMKGREKCPACKRGDRSRQTLLTRAGVIV